MTETRGADPVDYADSSIFPAGDSVSPGVKEATFAAFKAYVLGGSGFKYRVGGFLIDTPEADEPLLLHVFTDTATFADDWAGSFVDVGVAPAATFDIDIKKNGGSVGTLSISTGGAVTLTTSGTTVVFDPGDVLELVAPTTPDTTVARVAYTFVGST